MKSKKIAKTWVYIVSIAATKGGRAYENSHM